MDDTLGSILDASYEETLDCPGLCGLRRTQDIILGHKSSGRHDPDGWLLAKIDGVFAGAILLNHSREHNDIELVYLGLAPPVRGRGLGRLLLETQLATLLWFHLPPNDPRRRYEEHPGDPNL